MRSSRSGERLAQLLAAVGPGAVYQPDTDDVRGRSRRPTPRSAAGSARRAELREQARIVARAAQFQALCGLGMLGQAGPRAGDEAVRDLLSLRAGGYVQADVDAWFAQPWLPAAAPTPTRPSLGRRHTAKVIAAGRPVKMRCTGMRRKGWTADGGSGSVLPC